LLALYWKFDRYIIVLVLLISLSLQLSNAQDSIKVESPKAKIVKMDSLTYDTTAVIVIKHSPTKAALLSAAFPGLGQLYNKKYWKMPIVYAGIGISAYFLIKNQRLYKKYYDGWVNFSNTGSVNAVKEGGFSEIPDFIYKEKRVDYAFNILVNGYRRNRDWSFVALAGTYVLGILDAAVDAYLFDYDISDDLSLKARPTMMNTINGGNAFGLKLSFNLH